MLCAALPLLLLPQVIEEEPPAPWSLTWESQETLVDPDSFVQFIQSPVFRSGDTEMRATWAVFWLDRREMERLSEVPTVDLPAESLLLDEDPSPEPVETKAPLPNLFRQLAQTQLGGVAREVYLEGPVEVYAAGELRGTSSAIYLDLVDGHGWIANATSTMRRQFGGEEHVVRIRAKWLRHSADGSLHANSATVTSCDFEEPHYRITTGSLRIRPTDPDDIGDWDFKLRSNRLHLFGGVYVPLPPLDFHTEAGGKPILETFAFGDSARLGSFIQATFNREMGQTGEKLNQIFKGDPKDYDAHYGVSASLLGSRGILLDGSMELESKDHYWLNFHLGVIDDSGADRGLIRVPEADRATFRRWFRAEGRLELSDKEVLNLQASKQSDPAVQSEFFESEYLDYERRDNYVQWTRIDEQDYASATVRARFDDYRGEIEEFPALRFHRANTDVPNPFGIPLVHRADIQGSYLRRREPDRDGMGNPLFGELAFTDGLDRDGAEVVRLHTRQRLEAPISLGGGAWKAIPYLEGVGTAWDRSEAGDANIGRLALLAGVRIATTAWTRTAAGTLVRIVPFLDVRTDVAHETTTRTPVRFDSIEDPIDGEVAEIGVRTLIDSASGESSFDLEVRAGHVRSRESLAEDAWGPLNVFGSWKTRLWKTPIGVFHDGRYSLEGGGTIYSLTDLGFQLSPDLAMEFSYRSGNGGPSNALFETVGVSARYRWTEKWEFEGTHEISLIDDRTLLNRAIVRRFGHDLVFDLELRERTGEGTSIGFSISPLLSWGGSRIGLIRTLE